MCMIACTQTCALLKQGKAVSQRQSQRCRVLQCKGVTRPVLGGAPDQSLPGIVYLEIWGHVANLGTSEDTGLNAVMIAVPFGGDR